MESLDKNFNGKLQLNKKRQKNQNKDGDILNKEENDVEMSTSGQGDDDLEQNKINSKIKERKVVKVKRKND